MIKIIIPNNNIEERQYILDIVFSEFLGLEYEIVIRHLRSVKSYNWEIELENGLKLIIKDYFFNKYLKDMEYLKKESIPSKVEFVHNKYAPESDIPIIYGSSSMNYSTTTLVCGIDIFASCFFMLTRWEEYVNKNRDSHDRFLATESLALKNDFLHRPIVNEYIELLKNMLFELDNRLVFKEQKFELFLTHDVDSILLYPTLNSGIKTIVGDILKRKNIKLALTNILTKVQVHLGREKDPFDTFDYLMDISERLGVKSYFFFMGKGIMKFDNMYNSRDKFIKDLIFKIKRRGHYIGIHPTYNAYNNFEQFAKEKKELEKNLNTNITFGREHFLRFEVPTTWQIWEDNGMDWDSTLSFADKEGFRCGVCYEYSVFNILTRQKLKLKEKPLIIMDSSFATYQKNINSIEMKNKIKLLINKVEKYNGEFVFLWHNSSFNTIQWKKYQNIYERVLKENGKLSM